MDKEKTLRKLKQEIEEVQKNCGVEFAEVKHGEWIDEVELRPELYGWIPLGSVVCSLCNQSNSRETNYCPHCGAKMDGERRKQNV